MSSNSRRSYSTADRALLWSRSGGVCCFPDCQVKCVEEADNETPSVVIGQIAHIEAKSDNGPRANPALSEQQRDQYPNLILLCPTHHRLVDARESTYTSELLLSWKADRERIFQGFLAQEMGNVSFAELETITQALVNSDMSQPSPITVVPPREKMAKNGLTERTGDLVKVGLLKASLVQDYLEGISAIDRTFTGRLTSRFINEYQRQRTAGIEGDSLFEGMRHFSVQGRSDIRYQCAGLAVLVYLFERCEVFEQ